jgi:hypothetical protein
MGQSTPMWKKVAAAMSRNSMKFFPSTGQSMAIKNPRGFSLDKNRSSDKKC